MTDHRPAQPTEPTITLGAALMASAAVQEATKTFQPREVIASEGEPADRMIVVVNGWAARRKTLRSGERQIFGFLVPGDFTAIYPGLSYNRADDVIALSSCRIAELPVDLVEELGRRQPEVKRAVVRGAMVEAAVMQEWLVNLGRRSAEKRLAHLFCELSERLQAVGLADRRNFPLPVTQTTLGDALGLSPAHVNRSLQSLRSACLATFNAGAVSVSDMARLRKFAGFEDHYLGLQIEVSKFV